MAKTKNKRNTQAKSNDKLKALKDLYTCKVVLHNIALDKDLVQLYQLRFSEKTKEKVEHLSPCINTVRDSNNVQRFKKSIREDNVKDKTSCLTRRSRKLTNKKNEECKNIEFLADISLHNKKIHSGFIAQKQQSKHDTRIELLSSKSSDETSNTSPSIYCSTQRKTVSISNEKHHSNKNPNVQKKNRLGCKKKMQLDISGTSMKSMKISSDNTNYLDEENLTVTNCNSKMQEISSESIKKCKDNLLKVGVTNGTVRSVKLEQCEKNQNSKVVFPNIINKDVENNISEGSVTDSKSANSDLFTVHHIDINRTQKNASTRSNNKTTSLATDSTIQATNVLLEKTFTLDSSYPKIHVNKVPSNFLKTHNKNHANKKNIEGLTKKKLPKITGDHTLPKGTIKIMKVNTSDKNLENSVSKQIVLKRKKYTNSSTKQVSCIDDTLGATNIEEKKYHISKMDSSVNILKIKKSTSLNNNVNLNNKNIDNELYQTKIEHKSVKSLEIRNNIHNNTNDIKSVTTESYENCTLNQEQLNSSNNGEKHENILQHNEKCYKRNSDESILLKSTSNLVDVNESGNVNGLFVSKEEAIKQNRKRIAEEDTVKLNNKKKKLNRTIYFQNIAAYAKSLNRQESVENSEFPNIDTTVKSNVSGENISTADLREHLNKKRLKSPKLSPLENKFKITKNSVEFEQTDLNNKNYTITPTNTTKKEKFRKKLFSEEESTLNNTSYKTKDVQTDSVSNNHMHCHSTLQSTSEETQHLSQIDRSCENANVQEKHMNTRNEDDDDYISLFAESFDTNLCESTFFNERDKPSKSPQSDAPYITMTTSSFNEYIKQNTTEFNKEYAKYVEDSVKTSNETVKTKREFNNQSRQTIHTDCVPQTRTSKVITFETKKMEVSKWLGRYNLTNFINGYCYMKLRKGGCFNQSHCKYNHELQPLVNTVLSEDSRAILDMVQNAMRSGYNYFSILIYTQSLQKLTIDDILTTYRMFQHIHTRTEMTVQSKKYIVQNIIIELSNRQLSLKMIVNYFLEYNDDSGNLGIILLCIKRYIKLGEYWNTVKNLVLRLPLDKLIIEEILCDCIKSENLIDIEDINDNLISKASPTEISKLDKDVLERFKSLLAEKTVNDSHPVVIQNFGERASETIASPDGSTSLSQTDFLKRDNTFINKSANKIEGHSTEMNGVSYNNYIIRPIDDLPDARSAYRNHEHLWKFFVDLDGFKKGLEHNDYDYVINILRKYAEKQDESSLFVRSCCNILRTEVKRSEYHLKNIIRRTVQMGTFDILGKILFEIGLNVLTSLMDNEAWGLALYLIQSLNIHDLPYNAEYFLLSAEIYLANKKALKACDLLKSKNIICTSRDKWYVKSTITDERVRKELMYILLDSFCNESVEHAFFLFQFLLKDQCSQYYPIDLSRYVDKLIMLSLSKKDTSLIIEMGNIVLKYTFALNTTTCRALISTLIHMDENLARQIYNYAQGLGIYPAVKLWPVTYIIINTNLTEEEIYLTFLQLLKNLIINFGHAIEFAKSQIKVYLILEINSIDEQFYCTELHYNNRAITNIKELIRNVLKNRFDPSILGSKGSKGRIYKLQSKSVINYLKTEHCN